MTGLGDAAGGVVAGWVAVVVGAVGAGTVAVWGLGRRHAVELFNFLDPVAGRARFVGESHGRENALDLIVDELAVVAAAIDVDADEILVGDDFISADDSGGGIEGGGDGSGAVDDDGGNGFIEPRRAPALGIGRGLDEDGSEDGGKHLEFSAGSCRS